MPAAPLTLGAAMNVEGSMTSAIKSLFTNMENMGGAVTPIAMLQILHTCFPQFAEKNDQGVYSQQVMHHVVRLSAFFRRTPTNAGRSWCAACRKRCRVSSAAKHRYNTISYC